MPQIANMLTLSFLSITVHFLSQTTISIKYTIMVQTRRQVQGSSARLPKTWVRNEGSSKKGSGGVLGNVGPTDVNANSDAERESQEGDAADVSHGDVRNESVFASEDESVSDDDSAYNRLIHLQSGLDSLRALIGGMKQQFDSLQGDLNDRIEKLENISRGTFDDEESYEQGDFDREGNQEEREDNNIERASSLIKVLRFCGLSKSEARLFMSRAAKNWQELCHVNNADELIKTLNKSTKKDLIIDPRAATKVKVLIHWCKWINMTKGLNFNEDDFISNYDSHHMRWNNCIRLKNEPSKIPVPDTLDPKKWKEWLRSVTNYLASIYNEIGVPLIYTVWELLELEQKDDSELSSLEKFYKCTRTDGPTFITDSTRVHQIVMNHLTDSEAYAWIAKQAKGTCGRKLLLALSDHYDGEVSMVIRSQQALASIKSASLLVT